LSVCGVDGDALRQQARRIRGREDLALLHQFAGTQFAGVRQPDQQLAEVAACLSELRATDVGCQRE